MQFVPGFSRKLEDDAGVYAVLSGASLLCADGTPWQPLDRASWRFLGLAPREQHYIGRYGDQACYAVDVDSEAPLPAGYHWAPLRSLIVAAAIGTAEFNLASCALQVFNWDRSHQYCGRCGNPTIAHSKERARVCEGCEINYYPRISPCVIMLVTRGDECLLARNVQFKNNFFSALAGFVEPGETAEAAVHREVAEEVSVTLGKLHYFGSQPWPYPGQLMLGFHADYEAGDIVPDGVEIAEARWWHYQDLPPIPAAGTLSGMLIRHFVASRSAQ